MRCLKISCFLGVFASLFSILLFAQTDPFSECKLRYEGHKKVLLNDLARAEENYLNYRWSEIKIRRLYYERLWAARQDAMDAVRKEKRAQGKDEEARVLKALDAAEKSSANSSNGFLNAIRDFQSRDYDFSNACPERQYKECFQKAFKPAYAIAEEMKHYFDTVFEHEREYRLSVAKTVGDRQGLYPEDTVEPPEDHRDYYWRFEKGRQDRRFEEDKRIMDYLHDIEKVVAWKFEGDHCCYQCAVAKRNQKIENT